MNRLRPILAGFALILVLVTTAACQAAPQAAFPGAQWEYARGPALADLGWSAEALGRTRAFIRDSANTTGLVVVDRGRVVFTYGDIEELSYLASVRKSVLSILYGRYVEDGSIDLGSTLEELEFDDVGGLLDIERQATVRDLITARSGVYHPASNSATI